MENVSISLRLPVQLRDRVAKGAKIQHRSMTGAILAALEKAFPDGTNEKAETVAAVPAE